MSAKEKAKELVDKYLAIQFGDFPTTEAKQCALIAVDEIILSNPHSNPFNTDVYSTMYFWLQVKTEIGNL